MKKFFTFIIAVIALFAAVETQAANLADDDTRQALYGALDQAAESLKSAPFGNEPVAILPLKAKDSFLTGRLKNILVKSGFVCVEGKEDPMWDEILKEIEWDERKDDILDANTIVKFGKLKAAKILFQCQVRVVDKNKERVYAEVELRATDIATKQIIWGDTFAYRYYIAKDVEGIVDIDYDIRMLLKKNFEEAQNSLKSTSQEDKFNKIKTITVIPLRGDKNAYMTGLAIEMLVNAKFLPKNPQIPSLAILRSAARDGLAGSDAVFYGYVRTFHKTKPSSYQENKKIKTVYYVITDIQLFVEDVKNANVLWSKTITLNEPVVSEREMTLEERQSARGSLKKQIKNEIEEDLSENWKKYLMIFGIAVCVIILLAALIIALKAILSYNSVR